VQFIDSRKPNVRAVWESYVYEHATVDALTRRFGMSEKWIRGRLDHYELPSFSPTPRAMVAVGDATKIGCTWMLVMRDPNAHENVYFKEIVSEATSDYQTARAELERQGFVFTAFVGDGRVAVPWLFSDIPVQMCHFHQKEIIVRYTTLSPALPAGQELLALAQTLASSTKADFIARFEVWCAKWHDFLNERTVNEKTGRRSFTHRRLRSARTSLRVHLPYLFTFQDYPELNIPNTTNSLDGSFKKVKMAIGVHSGLTHVRKVKLVSALLMGRK